MNRITPSEINPYFLEQINDKYTKEQVDTKINDVESAIDKVEDGISTTVTDTVNKALESMDGEINDKINSSIEPIQSDIDSMNNEIAKNDQETDAEVANLKNNDSIIGGHIGQNTDSIKSLTSAVQTNTSNITGLDAKISELQATTTAHGSAVTGLGTEITNMTSEINTLKSNVNTNSSDIEDINMKLESLEPGQGGGVSSDLIDKVSTNTENITGLTTELNNLKVITGDHDSKMESMSKEINDAQNTVSANTESIGDMKKSISDNTANITDLSGSVSSVNDILTNKIQSNKTTMDNFINESGIAYMGRNLVSGSNFTTIWTNWTGIKKFNVIFDNYPNKIYSFSVYMTVGKDGASVNIKEGNKVIETLHLEPTTEPICRSLTFTTPSTVGNTANGKLSIEFNCGHTNCRVVWYTLTLGSNPLPVWEPSEYDTQRQALYSPDGMQHQIYVPTSRSATYSGYLSTAGTTGSKRIYLPVQMTTNNYTVLLTPFGSNSTGSPTQVYKQTAGYFDIYATNTCVGYFWQATGQYGNVKTK